MDRKKLFTIGEFARMWGVTVKALRYYEKIGVLRPVYINPQTGYRYYSHQQSNIMNAILICVELDIPLKTYREFTDDKGQIIYAEQLLVHGKKQAQKKLAQIHEGLARIEMLQEGITHIKRFSDKEEKIRYKMKAKQYLIAPAREMLSEAYFDVYNKLYDKTAAKGYQAAFELGYLHLYERNHVEKYQFIEIYTTENAPDIMQIPAGEYIGMASQQSRIAFAKEEFPDLFTQENADRKKIIIESELFVASEVDTSEFWYELRGSCIEKNEEV